MKKAIVAAAIAGALLVPVFVHAHGGHVHKVMGTVSSLNTKQLEVKTTDGKISVVSLTAKTVYEQEKAKVDLSRLKVGDRVVIEGTQDDGAKVLTAQTVRIGTAAAAKK